MATLTQFVLRLRRKNLRLIAETDVNFFFGLATEHRSLNITDKLKNNVHRSFRNPHGETS
jgi:hypothetical protein